MLHMAQTGLKTETWQSIKCVQCMPADEHIDWESGGCLFYRSVFCVISLNIYKLHAL